VSGPLASWVGEHSKASWRGRAVLIQYALAANHDGTPAADVSRDDLEHRTGHGHSTIVKGRQEALALGELEQLEAPVGRGNVGRYRVHFTLCPDEARCWVCPTLADLLDETVRDADAFESGKRLRQSGKRLRQSGKRLPRRRTTETETYTSQGGTSPPGESDDARSARSPRGARSARSGSTTDPATARRELADRETTEAAAAAIYRLDDREVVARWQQSADAPSA
jgi:hypothetical protein